MKHGDISSHLSPVIAFNLNTLIKRVDTSNPIKRLLSKPKLDLNMVKTINTLWSKYNYRIYIVSLQFDESNLLDILDHFSLNYTRFEKLDFRELEWKCKNEFTYYYDSDYNTISGVNSSSAKHITELTI